MILTHLKLNNLLGKHISAFCGKEAYVADNINHCAHFVSHVLNMSYRTTCASMTHQAKKPASIRVQELFPYCPHVGIWEAKPADLIQGLAFITAASGVDLSAKSMANVPRKHVGIFCGCSEANIRIWHYSNSRNKVVSQTPEAFSRHYTSPHNAMFWGTFPPGIQWVEDEA